MPDASAQSSSNGTAGGTDAQRHGNRKREAFLSTQPAGQAERRLAQAVVLVSALFFILAVPYARTPVGEVRVFIPIYESALVMCDLITAVLLFGQFGFLRDRALLVLACGYLFTATITVIHGLTFPGAFTPTGLLGAGTQSTAWLYMFWHGGFPLLVMVYALHGKAPPPAQDPARPRGSALPQIAGGVALVALAVTAITLLVTGAHAVLPPVITGTRYTPQAVFMLSITWAMSLAALLLLWRRRPHTVLDLWLSVVMCVWLFDVALSAVLNGGRFDFGFYAGRAYGLLAAGFVLAVLLIDNGRLYARLVAAYESERVERRRVQEKTTELTRVNRDLDAFSYSVSHDLRAPLRAVDGYARILEEDYSDRLDSEGRRLLGVMRDGSRRMNSLIEELLDFSRLGREPLATVPVALDDLVRQTIIDLAAERAGRGIEFAVADLGTADADAALLRHALANLISNAIKYTRRAERARIEVGVRRGPAPDDIPIYYVRDNGAGFDMQYASRLFGVFQRLHHADEFEGTGVGLAIVQRVINRHGGQVWAEAKPGEGACFYFTLKAAVGAEAQDEDASRPEDSSQLPPR